MNTKTLYTSVSKGGKYELIGTSSGAGSLKGLPLMIYRDTTTGQMFHREPEEFATRMKSLTPKLDAAALLEQNAKLLAAINGMEADIINYPHDMAIGDMIMSRIKAVKAGA